MPINLLAPSPYQQFQTRNGTRYTADQYGIVSSVPVGTDIIDLTTSGCISLGIVGARSNYSATVDPVATNDSTQDYAVGSRWINLTTGIEWICQAATANAAVWLPQVGAAMLLGRIIGANMNVTTDQPFVLTNWASLNPFRITKITAKNASVSLTTAAGGVYPSASKGGTAIVAAGQLYSALTTSTLAVDLTLAVGTTVYAKGGAPILSLTTAQGVAATADLYLFGDIYC